MSTASKDCKGATIMPMTATKLRNLADQLTMVASMAPLPAQSGKRLHFICTFPQVIGESNDGPFPALQKPPSGGSADDSMGGVWGKKQAECE